MTTAYDRLHCNWYGIWGGSLHVLGLCLPTAHMWFTMVCSVYVAGKQLQPYVIVMHGVSSIIGTVCT